MNVIAFGTIKGGTGKTTVTYNLGAKLAETSKVLLIDMDPQSNLSQNMRIDISDRDEVTTRHTVRQIFERDGKRKADPDPSSLIVTAPIPELPNLDIMPSNLELNTIERDLGNRANRERIFRNYLLRHEGFFDQYDNILIDTNAAMTDVNRNAFAAADHIVLVTDVDSNSLTGILQFEAVWQEILDDLNDGGMADMDNAIDALLINRFIPTRVTAKELWANVSTDECFAPYLLSCTLPDAEAFKNSALSAVPVTMMRQDDSTIKAQAAICGVTAELTKRGIFM